ncbi:molybdenum ABC transporter, periplasmic molybdate-binding protein [Thiorhodococcus drewsii AZ1]|uniref:Molybdenum ABC transporter, periplasmic molybdate-binding protein n=1 Tax=Thiorhodococcus drewsii AZ1 TaxID=765913 RepID=G2DVV9_9GAMM|nr:molybdate ABC transporter substrate-binding protein [Thiorhodococcus drewsii]EGV33865.1 molybdenum ABC transporter, periplasmic molybdate-binding protein [Thiorhodococcus drewsii AZ1]
MKVMHKTLAVLLLASATTLAQADEVKVAVAANFTAAMKEIATAFEQSTGHTALVSFGSTGKLYTQIVNGAPFEVFLAADQARPEKLVKANEASGEFTYAVGKLVLWSADPALITDGDTVLRSDRFKKLAIANPKTAPYGAAAVEVLKALGLEDDIKSKLVQGDNIAQTYQFVATKNAELGFVALAQTVKTKGGSSWSIPEDLYTPIRQDAVLLKKGDDNPAAKVLIDYLKGPEARAVIEKYGYGVE